MANAEKVAAVAELTERFQTSNGTVLANYRGLTVAQLAELRRALGEQATFAVVKNTLTKIAATEAGVADQIGDLLTGPSAIAFVKGDPVEAAKGLRDFAKTNPLLVIKGGVLDGKSLSATEIGKPAMLRWRRKEAGARFGPPEATNRRFRNSVVISTPGLVWHTGRPVCHTGKSLFGLHFWQSTACASSASVCKLVQLANEVQRGYST